MGGVSSLPLLSLCEVGSFCQRALQKFVRLTHLNSSASDPSTIEVKKHAQPRALDRWAQTSPSRTNEIAGSWQENALIADKIAVKVLAGAFSCLRQIADMVEKCFSLKLSQTSIAKILKVRNIRNIRKLKSASLPVKADPTLQRSFYEDELLPLMKKSQQNKCILHFMDAAHFVMGCDFRFFYGLGRRFVSPSVVVCATMSLGRWNMARRKCTP